MQREEFHQHKILPHSKNKNVPFPHAEFLFTLAWAPGLSAFTYRLPFLQSETGCQQRLVSPASSFWRERVRQHSPETCRSWQLSGGRPPYQQSGLWLVRTALPLPHAHLREMMSAQALELDLDRERSGQCSEPLPISVGQIPYL